MTAKPNSKTTDTSSAQLIAHRLVEARRQQGLKLQKVAEVTKIKPKLLKQFEAGQADLNNPYHRGLITAYGQYLGIDNIDYSVMGDPPRLGGEAAGKVTLWHRFRPLKTVVLANTATKTAAFGFISVMVGAVGLLVIVFTAAPRLSVIEPADNAVINNSFIQVRGQTSPSSDILVNGSAVPVDPAGMFHERVFLLPGVNVITVEATNSLSRTARVERVIIARYELPTPGHEQAARR